MKLFGFPYSHNTRKVLATAHALDVELELVIVNLLEKESYTPAFKRKNPNGLTPVLEDGDFLLWESGAIMQYLCAHKPGNSLYPDAPAARAKVDQWLYWNARHWDTALDTMLIERLIKPLEGNQGDEEIAKRAEADGAVRAQVLGDHLASQPFVTGEDFTLADIALASLLAYHHLCPLPIIDQPNILSWYDRVKAQPCWQATEPDWSAINEG
ncbi:MAG: glutathione S-transferase family protein [Pseudomonadota bacterium]